MTKIPIFKKKSKDPFETSKRTERKIRRSNRAAEKRSESRQENIDRGTPSNPRFLSGAPTRSNGKPIERPNNASEKKTKKAKAVKRKGRCGGMTRGGTQQGRGRRTSASCRN